MSPFPGLALTSRTPGPRAALPLLSLYAAKRFSQLVDLGAQVGDHLSDESEPEQRDTYDAEQHDESQQRAKSVPQQSHDHSGHADEEPESEENQTSEPEQQHGFAAELKKEPDGDQVEQPDQHATRSRVLGGTALARMEGDVDLASAVAACMGEYHEEAVPIVT